MIEEIGKEVEPTPQEETISSLRGLIDRSGDLNVDANKDALSRSLAQVMIKAQHKILRGDDSDVAACSWDTADQGKVAIIPEQRWVNVATEIRPGMPKTGIVVKDWWCEWSPQNYMSSTFDWRYLSAIWMETFAANFEEIKKINLSLKDLYSTERGGEGPYEGKPAYLVGSGPSLKRNHKDLDGITNGVVISVNGSLPLVADPDFFLTVDWKGADWWTEGQEEKIRHTTALLSWSASPKLYALPWNERRVYGYMGNCAWDQWIRNVMPWINDLDRGQTSMFCAFHLAILMGCNPIVFVGVDHSFPDKKMHALTDEDAWTGTDFTERRDVNGNLVMTSGEHILFNQHMLGGAFWATEHGVKIINATEGGIFWDTIGRVQIKPLADTVRDLNGVRVEESEYFTPAQLGAEQHV